MGLISGLLTLPLAPLRGVVAAADQVRIQAEDEFYDPVRIRGQLEDIQRRRDENTIDDDEATAWEDELVERLMVARERARGEH